jgi:hypothetical protein
MDLADGNTADALSGFVKVLAIDPKNLVATTGAAMAAGAGGDRAGAEKWLLKATADHPSHCRPRWRWCVYLGTGNRPRPRRSLTKKPEAPTTQCSQNMRACC